MPLLILNKYIEASLLGTRAGDNSKSSLATLMDTNQVIRKVARNLGVALRHKLEIVKTQKASNPYTFYHGLITYLHSNPLTFIKIVVGDAGNSKTLNKDVKNLLNTYSGSKRMGPQNALDFFILERWSEDSPIKSWAIPQNIKITYRGETHNYKLDSAVLRDTTKVHFSAYITCNGKPFGFDGESFARMTPFNWQKKMNKDTKWRFSKQYDTYFNFQRGILYVILL